MGLRADIQRDIGAAFDGDLADAVQPFDLMAVSGSYDPVTGTPGRLAQVATGRGVFERHAAAPAGQGSMGGDNARFTEVYTLIVLANELPRAPSVADQIQWAGRLWDISSVVDDPAAATYTITIVGT